MLHKLSLKGARKVMMGIRPLFAGCLPRGAKTSACNLQVMSRAEQIMNDCARLRIPSTFPPVEVPCSAQTIRAIAQKLAALCPLLLPQCFHIGAE